MVQTRQSAPDIGSRHYAAAATPEPPHSSETLEGDPPLGETVSITPLDYGLTNLSSGTLVSIDATQIVLLHRNDRVGEIVVHFPRFCYQVRSVSA